MRKCKECLGPGSFLLLHFCKRIMYWLFLLEKDVCVCMFCVCFFFDWVKWEVLKEIQMMVPMIFFYWYFHWPKCEPINKIGKLSIWTWTLFCNGCIVFLNSQIWKEIMLELNGKPSSVTTLSFKSFNIQKLLHHKSKHHRTKPMHPFLLRAFQRHQEHNPKHVSSVDLITTKQNNLPS